MKSDITHGFYRLACLGLGLLVLCAPARLLGCWQICTNDCSNDPCPTDDCSQGSNTPIGNFGNYAVIGAGPDGATTSLAATPTKLAGRPYLASLPELADAQTRVWDGINSFSVYDGNARREVDDLPAQGAAAVAGLPWIRWNNTMPRDGRQYFGSGGDWRHNWQYELWIDEQGDLILTYPSGVKRTFKKTGAGGWAALPRFSEQVVAVGDGCEVTTADHMKLRFARINSGNREATYSGNPQATFGLLALTDAQGQATMFEYNQRGYLTKVAGPAGKELVLTYRDYTIKTKPRWQKLAEIKTVPAAGQWLEIAVSPNLQSGACQQVRLSSAVGDPLTVAGMQSYAAGSSAPLLETSKASPVARIRVLAAPGRENLLQGAWVEGLLPSIDASKPVLAQVVSSDGRSVTYDYETMTSRNVPVLSQVHYGDGTKATYRYALVATHENAPLLAETDDPRYNGRAKKIRYTYQVPVPHNFGMVHQEIDPATGAVYASLELDPKDAEVRIVRYSDQRSEFYRVPEATYGRMTEHVDALGRRTRNEYAGQGAGALIATIDPTGCRTDRIYDQHGRIIETHRSDGGWQKIERDADGNITRLTDSHGRLFTAERDADGHMFVNDNQAQSDPRSVQVASRVDPADPSQVVSGDPAARVERNDRGLITTITHPDGLVQQFAYDDYGRKISETDGLGHTLHLAYDALGRVVREEDFSGGITQFDYAETPKACRLCTVGTQPSRIQYPDGRVDEMLYDPEGRLLARTVGAGAPDAATTMFAYDDADRLIMQTDPSGKVTHYAYDQNGNRTISASPRS